MSRRIQKLVLLATFLVWQNAFGWGDLGHQTIGELAERLLAGQPKTKQALQAILGIEPLALSSTWADGVRSDTRFQDFSSYHYFTTYRDGHRDEKSALTILKQYPAFLRDPKVSREAKMMALRFLIHVVEDVHQPLHSGNEFDRGANFCKVKWRPAKESPIQEINLHKVWDTSLIDVLVDQINRGQPKDGAKGSERWFGYKELADALLARHPVQFEAKAEIDVEGWLKDSARIRAEQIYPDKLDAAKRPYCQADASKILAKEIPLLDEKYVQRAMPLLEDRMMAGALHLASFLHLIFKDEKSALPNESEIIKSLQLSRATEETYRWPLQQKKKR